MNKHTQDYIIERMKELEPNYDFSNFIYIRSDIKSIIVCDKGHEYKMCWDNFKQGQRCPICKGIKNGDRCRLSPIVALIRLCRAEPDYDFSKFVYINNYTKSTVICNRGHEYQVRYDNFMHSNRCPYCGSSKSKPESEIIQFIKTFYNGSVEQSNRSVIKSPFSNRYLELDIYLPDINLAIEFNGRYYHTDEKAKKLGWNSIQEYHKYKSEQCKQRCIYLIHIDENDWRKDKDKCLEYIKHNIEHL